MRRKLKKYDFSRNTLKTVPQEPGVYIFYDENGSIIYIGKSRSLRDRLRSYLNKNIFGKTDKLVQNIKKLSLIKVESEVEALLLEARLIKQYKPYYNIALKDDKSNLFVCITDEKYSRLITARPMQLNTNCKYLFGPFVNSYSLRSILKLVRKFCPYSTHLPSKTPCFYSQLGLCYPCPSIIEKTKDTKEKRAMVSQYKSNVRYLVRFFRGDFTVLKKEFYKKMIYYSDKEEYENAKAYKEKIGYLNTLLAPSDRTEMYTEDPYYINTIKKRERKVLEKIINSYWQKSISIKRIECYDISHIQGSHSAGSMVTFVNSSPEKKYYRHFRLLQSKNNDVHSLYEIATRRVRHLKNWGVPDLIIVDGGKGQVNAFKKVFAEYAIPVVGIAKRYEKLIIPQQNGRFASVILKGDALNLIQRIRDEAHRFAQKYHHLLVNKYLIKTDKIS